MCNVKMEYIPMKFCMIVLCLDRDLVERLIPGGAQTNSSSVTSYMLEIMWNIHKYYFQVDFSTHLEDPDITLHFYPKVMMKFAYVKVLNWYLTLIFQQYDYTFHSVHIIFVLKDKKRVFICSSLVSDFVWLPAETQSEDVII